ncbi:MAG: hypothetical protein ACM3JI_01060 [Anaerolineae bacterium]
MTRSMYSRLISLIIGLSNLIICCWAFATQLTSSEITQILREIPQKERNNLEWFFRHAVAEDSFAYVIFGSKPMAISGYCDFSELRFHGCFQKPDEFIYSLFETCDALNLRIKNGFEAWQKYRNYFCTQKYVFKKCKNIIKNDFVCVVIVNIDLFVNTVEKHLDVFQKALGQHITPDFLLEKIERDENIFSLILKDNETLIGTLLGYGIHNATLFHQRRKISNKCPRSYIYLAEEKIKPLSGFSSTEKELQYDNKKLKSFAPRKELVLNPLFMQLPVFVADLDDPETKTLKKTYEKEQKKILKKYKDNDFLEITLGQLTRS